MIFEKLFPKVEAEPEKSKDELLAELMNSFKDAPALSERVSMGIAVSNPPITLTTKERNDLILGHFNSGKTKAEISRMSKVSPQRVGQIIKASKKKAKKKEKELKDGTTNRFPVDYNKRSFLKKNFKKAGLEVKGVALLTCRGRKTVISSEQDFAAFEAVFGMSVREYLNARRNKTTQ